MTIHTQRFSVRRTQPLEDNAKVDAPAEDSDYGSDLEVDVLDRLVQDVEARLAEQSTIDKTTEKDEHADIASWPSQPVVQQVDATGDLSDDLLEAFTRLRDPVETECDRDASTAFTATAESLAPTRFESAKPDTSPADSRSPLERLRTRPKKPLSVTDLVSPAWCELQYWYSLTKFGRVKRTPAMKQGSAVHQVLEDQVHTTVPVEIQTREDHWALRIWNIIQGLRTLRVTGQTRELELWGTVDGQVVNGIIDELSSRSTDPGLDLVLSGELTQVKKDVPLSGNQTTISEYFKATGGKEFKSAVKTTVADLPSEPHHERMTYIIDVKTRGKSTVPPDGPSLRPTRMQLMLYRKLLSKLASNEVDAAVIFDRYGLEPSANFSESFIAQLSALDMNFSSTANEDSYAPMESNVDTCAELLSHNNLLQLWQLMIQEFQMTMPQGAESISKVLKAEFRKAGDGTIIGSKTFLYNDHELQPYLAEEMRWWRGEREARGVDIEEAFKCRFCEFAEGCTWRINKVDDAVQSSRLRTSARTKLAW